MEGINQGKPVNIFALQYSIKAKLITINKIGDEVFGVNNLPKTNAKDQKAANILGKIIIDKGIRYMWYVSATRNAEPIQYSPNENHPKPRNQDAINIFFNEDNKLIE